MSLNALTSIGNEYRSLILIYIVPFLLISGGLALTITNIENTSLSHSVREIYGIVLILSVSAYTLYGTCKWLMTTRMGVRAVLATIFILILYSFVLAIPIVFVDNSPYSEECHELDNISNISVSECMSVVEMNPSYTGQEIIDSVKSAKTVEKITDSVKSDKIVEKITELDILDRPLKPYS